MADLFPLNSKSMEVSKNIKEEIRSALFHVIQENISLWEISENLSGKLFCLL